MVPVKLKLKLKLRVRTYDNMIDTGVCSQWRAGIQNMQTYFCKITVAHSRYFLKI